jgi:hypothetical protein
MAKVRARGCNLALWRVRVSGCVHVCVCLSVCLRESCVLNRYYFTGL